jgi:hypothetical protein
MNKLLMVLLGAVLVLTASAAEKNGLPAARAAFDQGNRLLREARESGDSADLLTRAAQQYRECLSQETNTANAGRLFADARHNLEMVRLLLTQVGHPENAKAGAQGKERCCPECGRPLDEHDQKGNGTDPSNSADKSQADPKNDSAAEADKSKDGSDKAKDGSDKAKEGADNAKDGQENAKSGTDKAKEGADKSKDDGDKSAKPGDSAAAKADPPKPPDKPKSDTCST